MSIAAMHVHQIESISENSMKEFNNNTIYRL